MEPIEQYEQALLGALGSLTASKVVSSKDANKVIRDASKHIESLGVNLRRHLIEQDKLLTINPSTI